MAVASVDAQGKPQKPPMAGILPAVASSTATKVWMNVLRARSLPPV